MDESCVDCKGACAEDWGEIITWKGDSRDDEDDCGGIWDVA